MSQGKRRARQNINNRVDDIELDPRRIKPMESRLREIGSLIDTAINKVPMVKPGKFQEVDANERRDEAKQQYGFAVLIFSLTGPETSYISNCERETMIKALEELLERWKRMSP